MEYEWIIMVVGYVLQETNIPATITTNITKKE